jgi:hypothetical protein
MVLVAVAVAIVGVVAMGGGTNAIFILNHRLPFSLKFGTSSRTQMGMLITVLRVTMCAFFAVDFALSMRIPHMLPVAQKSR